MMHTYTVTMIKIGNSYALQVPKQYIVDAQLEVGQKVTIGLPYREKTQSRSRIQFLLQQLNAPQPNKSITNPQEWQHTLRTDRPLPGRES